MRQGVAHVQHRDEFGRPAGGEAAGIGISIRWQDGPLVAPDGRRLEANGCFVETVLQVVAGFLIALAGVVVPLVRG